MQFDRHAKYALIVALSTLLLSGIGFRFAVAKLNIYLRKEPVPCGTLAAIPRTLGRWEMVGEDAKYDESLVEALGTDHFLDRHYALDGDLRTGVLNVHLAYYTGMIDAVPHVPNRCFVAAGLSQQSQDAAFPLQLDTGRWRIDPGPVNRATGQPYRLVDVRDAFTNLLKPVRMPIGEFSLRTTEFGRKDRPDLKVFAGFFFIANGRATSTAEDIRLLAFKPSERYAYYCKVQFVYAAPGATRERFLELTSGFLDDFLPELMLRLPDWQQIEGRSHSIAAGSAASNHQPPTR